MFFFVTLTIAIDFTGEPEVSNFNNEYSVEQSVVNIFSLKPDLTNNAMYFTWLGYLYGYFTQINQQKKIPLTAVKPHKRKDGSDRKWLSNILQYKR